MPRRLPAIALFLFALCALPGCNTGNAHLGLIGKPAPGLPALHLPGGSLAAFHGKVVVLNFWASWCAPCLEEFPSLTALQEQMPGVAVLAVSFDQDPSAYANFLRVHHVTLRTALDATGQSNEAFGTTRPPETFILDSNGIVRRKFIGPQDWTSPEIKGYLRAIH